MTRKAKRKVRAVEAWAQVTPRGRIVDVALNAYQIHADADLAGEQVIRVRIQPIRARVGARRTKT